MAILPADSIMFRSLFGDREVGALFADSAEIRAILLFEGALARAGAAEGIVPEDSAWFIDRATREVQIDPAGLEAGTARDGVLVPALVTAFRRAMEAPEHAKWVHHGATSQDAVDTGLVLRLRRMLEILDTRLATLHTTLRGLALREAGTVMAARTRGQMATPTTLGAKVAVWADPLPRHRARLEDLKPRLLRVSLAGASGTRAALGPDGHAVMERLAGELGLAPAPIPWHASRDTVAELGGWLALVTGTLGKMGQDLILLGQSEIREVRAGTGGGSSTMPHKSNPVAAEALVTLARRAPADLATLHQSMLHAQERDGAAWAAEWTALPALAVAAAAALRHAQALAGSLVADPDRMRAGIDATDGLMMAEAAVFALARHMPRPEAQELVKAACAEVVARGDSLAEVLGRMSDVALDWDTVLDPSEGVGEAPLYPAMLPES